jgi:hypothetical protein
MERALRLGLVLVGLAAAVVGCEIDTNSGIADESSPPSRVVTADSTKVVITDRTEPDASAGCAANGQIYTIDLVARTLDSSVCRVSRTVSGSMQLTAADSATLQQALDAVYLIDSDTGATGYTTEDYLELAVTTDGTTQRYLDLFYPEENGVVNIVSGVVNVLLDVQSLVDASQSFTLADASVGTSADGSADVQIDASADAPADAGSDAATDAAADAH